MANYKALSPKIPWLTSYFSEEYTAYYPGTAQHKKCETVINKNEFERKESKYMYDQVTLGLNVDPFILSALKEDITSEDVSTNSVMPHPQAGEVDLICKQDGIICGLQVFERVFTLLDADTKVEFYVKDGDKVENKQLIGKVYGDIRVLLCGERTALNYLQRMSGIATYTSQVAALLEGTGIRLLDTRKTTPNNRIFEKYSVRVGGGNNHRYNLSDGVLLKDNHIGAAGGVKEAIADYIDGRAEIEVSGNVTKENIERIKGLGVDYVSSGALTHSAPIMDLSLKNLHAV